MRFFGSRPSSRNGKKAASPVTEVTARLLVSNHGAIMMNHGPSRQMHDNDMSTTSTKELSGELEIHVPRGSGRKRCRAIRIRLRQTSRLYMGKDRGWEKDTLFERTIENRGAIILEEGVQRFRFGIHVPYSLAPFDIHSTGDIRITLIAEVDGLMSVGPGTPSIASVDENAGSGGYWAYKHWLIDGERRRSSLSSSGTSTPSDEHGPPEINIRPFMTVSWNDPVTSADEDIPWMKGTVTATRCVCVIYNPDPDGNVTALDLRRDGNVPALGVFECWLMSDVWTVCALLKTTINVPAPDPRVTIFYFRVILEQTAALTSPRDCDEERKPIVTTTTFVVYEQGQRPPNRGAGRGHPALWRGKEAGGRDSDGITLSGIGRLPNDETGRPSTLEGIITPIVVSHKLVVEVYYSVDGQDVTDQPIPKNMPAPIRLLRIDKPVTVPSCGCIPENLALPTYEDHEKTAAAEAECGTCKLKPNDQVCRACELTALLHPRHDLAEFGPSGTCPDCEKRFLQSDEKSKWMDCACGLTLDTLHERMARVIPAEVDSVGDCFNDLTLNLATKLESSRPATPTVR